MSKIIVRRNLITLINTAPRAYHLLDVYTTSNKKSFKTHVRILLVPTNKMNLCIYLFVSNSMVHNNPPHLMNIKNNSSDRISDNLHLFITLHFVLTRRKIVVYVNHQLKNIIYTPIIGKK